jgi:hypothetical protein
MKRTSQRVENTAHKRDFSPCYQQSPETSKAPEIAPRNKNTSARKHINKLLTNIPTLERGSYYNMERSRTQAEKLQSRNRLNLVTLFATLRTFDLKPEKE